jgi:hypothetical protein
MDGNFIILQMKSKQKDPNTELLLTLDPTQRALVEAAAQLQGTPVIGWAELAVVEFARPALYAELREESDASDDLMLKGGRA